MTKDFKLYVSKCAEFCRDNAFLGMNRIDFKFSQVQSDMDSDEGECAFDVVVSEEYYMAVITAYPIAYTTWLEGNYKRLGRMILHEICHILLKPMQEEMMMDAAPSQLRTLQKIVEKTTQHIAIAIDYHMPKNWWHPKKFGIGVDKAKKTK